MDAFITRRGGNGSPLNFEIVGGTTQPENPKENTIWVNTETEITGWSFSENEPTSPAHGNVWFETNDNGEKEFNALTENEMIISPVAARQYASSGWIDRDAYIYQFGSWTILMSGTLYDNGEEFNDKTGGWTVLNASANATCAIMSDHIQLGWTAADHLHAVVRTQNKIEFPYGKYTTLKMLSDMSSFFANDGVKDTNRFGLTTNSGVLSATNQFSYVTTYNTPGTGLVTSLDISGAEGEFYVAVLNVGRGKIYKIWLE